MPDQNVMNIYKLLFTKRTRHHYSIEELKWTITRFAFFNLFLVALLGVVLRSYPLFPIPFFGYRNLMHAHSHFAFAGWVMPILFVSMMKYFPELTKHIGYKHLKNIAALLLVSAYGMLFSFPFQGYATLSIGFSTLSILACFYMAVLFWIASAGFTKRISIRFLKAGLFFLVLSSLGPFATGPLVAMGKGGTDIYYNAIYFYLHFQYNGWFTFAILAILYKMLEKDSAEKKGKVVFYLFTIACPPAYFLSTLWSHPPAIFYLIALVAAIAQVIAVVRLLKDIRPLLHENGIVTGIIKLAIVVFVLKNIFQLLSAIPAMADLAYSHRNLIIAYLHMVLLGFVSAFALAAILKGNELYIPIALKRGILLFAISFLFTELLLVLNAGGINMNFAKISYPQLLLLFSLFFAVSTFLVWNSCRRLFVFQLNEQD